ncbi:MULTISPECIES: hypothetical protein [unclassified Curtobacterium]|uniref:hypothetical protein n=1 Tax=unclassified Curtobacterium TaxID=257496 RepID=UPI000DA97CF0|nr:MULTISPECIES: hypothetical protein [unclassified Curtobacterium]PZF59382.1 hypothetical protein DEI81_13980 [Curtobacterium sp. MCBD17_013]PZE24348.1 hypothetical protein DEI86_12595 [Curtobacterium sp. MCBD17_028]WIB64543.1 hypothetical protein DEI94_04980 [Curtobacterium sp. MCBD17_040]WIB68384.1 hypothetical protein DEI93_04945 [Curtobacterium sp. MCBD17_035]WIE55570.1 hypothetical protein DEI88_005060 [Curtobacterium sp. MCBD17_003]
MTTFGEGVPAVVERATSMAARTVPVEAVPVRIAPGAVWDVTDRPAPLAGVGALVFVAHPVSAIDAMTAVVRADTIPRVRTRLPGSAARPDARRWKPWLVSCFEFLISMGSSPP